jgi:cytochrome P450
MGFIGRPRVVVFGPEVLHQALMGPAIRKTSMFGVTVRKSLLGRNVLTEEGQARMRHRQLVLRAFSARYLRGYQGIMRDMATQFLEQWKPGMQLDMAAEIKRLSESIASRLIFGFDITGGGNDFAENVAAVERSVKSPVTALLSALLPFDVPGLANGRTTRERLKRADETLRELGERQGERRSVLHALLELSQQSDVPWRLEEIRANLLQLYFAGFDTTRCATIWTLFLLAQHPEVCSRVLDELHQQLGGRDPEHEDLSRLTYLHAVVDESLRLYPTGPVGFRQTDEPLQVGDYALPADTVFVYTPWVTHRIPRIYPEPERFLPERFAGGKKYPISAYLPFGFGPDSCVAGTFAQVQIKTLVSMLLRRFRLDVLPGQTLSLTLPSIQLLPGLQVRVMAQDGDTRQSPAKFQGDLGCQLPGDRN